MLARLLLVLICFAFPAQAERLTVAVAANFLTTAEDITAAFSAETGHDVALVQLDSAIPAATAAPFRVDRLPGPNRAVSVVSYARGRAEALSWQLTPIPGGLGVTIHF